MPKKDDLLLLGVIFVSMGSGIFFPKLGAYFCPYPLYLMMFLLFLSFLSINLSDVTEILARR